MLRGACIGKKDRPYSIHSGFGTRRSWSTPCIRIGVPRKRTTMRSRPSSFGPVCAHRERLRSHEWRALQLAKGRVYGSEQEATKTGEDRRIDLCPRAIAILESHRTSTSVRWNLMLAKIPCGSRAPPLGVRFSLGRIIHTSSGTRTILSSARPKRRSPAVPVDFVGRQLVLGDGCARA